MAVIRQTDGWSCDRCENRGARAFLECEGCGPIWLCPRCTAHHRAENTASWLEQHGVEMVGHANLRLPTLSMDGDYYPEELEVTSAWFGTLIMIWRETAIYTRLVMSAP
jgi:hypothetical protein